MTRLVVLLFVLGCRAAAPASERTSEQYPPLPVSVPTPLGSVRVVLRPNLVADSVKVWGVWLADAREIRIEARATRAMQWRVLDHELCHVEHTFSGLAYLMPEPLAEALCEARSVARFRERFG